jgi:HK97 family phage portal protein
MYAGRNRAPVVMNASTEFQVLSNNAQESQLLESQVNDLTTAANILGLPAYYLGSPNSSRTYSNVEQENLQLVRWSIQPIAQRIEEALSDLLVRGQNAKFNYDSLLRTDTKSRYEAHALAIQNGFLTVDEVRAMEQRDPIDQDEDIEEIDSPDMNEIDTEGEADVNIE